MRALRRLEACNSLNYVDLCLPLSASLPFMVSAPGSALFGDVLFPLGQRGDRRCLYITPRDTSTTDCGPPFCIFSCPAANRASRSLTGFHDSTGALLDRQNAISYHCRFFVFHFILALARRKRLAVVPRGRPFISAIWLTV